MTLSIYKILWFLFSLAAAFLVGFIAFKNSIHFANNSDSVATTLSIFVGVSLAVSALFTSPAAKSGSAKDKRVAKVNASIDRSLINGQNILFLILITAIIFALIAKHWLGLGFESTDGEATAPKTFKMFISAYSFVSTFALLWSATLPSLLRGVILLKNDSA